MPYVVSLLKDNDFMWIMIMLVVLRNLRVAVAAFVVYSVEPVTLLSGWLAKEWTSSNPLLAI